MAVKNYGIFDKWLNSGQQNVVDVKSTDGVINSVKVNGQEYGGGSGGSSDFSTAEVTIVNNTSGGEIENRVPFCGAFPDDTYEAMNCIIMLTNTAPLNTVQRVVALYKGSAFIVPMGSFDNASATGSATYDAINECFIITGDCTITIS